jgi:hypothetical protein
MAGIDGERRLAARTVVACAGFLLGVLWMDLMFDVQGLGHPGAPAPLPEAVLASIAGYYRRVTTDASPMGVLIGVVMMLGILAASAQAWRTPGPLWRRLLPVALLAGPIVLALARVFPDAIRLGARLGAPDEQSALARSICRAHLACFASVGAALVGQLRRGGERPPRAPAGGH